MNLRDWQLWSWQHIAGTDGSRYISRLHVFRTPFGGVQLHWIHRPDEERHMHNHPRRFIRLVLRGGYCEQVDTGVPATTWSVAGVSRWKPSVMQLGTFHRITVVAPGTLSLCIVGPERQAWGFRTEQGFIEWRDYFALQKRVAAPEQGEADR